MRLRIVSKVNGKDVLSGSMLHNINGFVVKKYGEFLLGGVSDCEEISGSYSQEMMGLVLGYNSLYVTLLKCSDVPEVLEVQEVPFLTYWYVS